jgi:hypothetical protein
MPIIRGRFFVRGAVAPVVRNDEQGVTIESTVFAILSRRLYGLAKLLSMLSPQ